MNGKPAHQDTLEQVTPQYQHTQRAPLCLLIYVPAAIQLALAAAVDTPPPLRWVFLTTGLIMLLLAASFHSLTVRDAGDHLQIQFGPLPLFRRAVPYVDIQSVSAGRTTLLDGWGIHWSLSGRGWVWNLWGRDCVVLQLQRGRLHVGTDDVHRLADFLARRIESAATP